MRLLQNKRVLLRNKRRFVDFRLFAVFPIKMHGSYFNHSITIYDYCATNLNATCKLYSVLDKLYKKRVIIKKLVSQIDCILIFRTENICA